MKKTSHLLLLSATLFLSTFFVGCKPQGEPIALEDIKIESTKKVVKKTPSVEKPVQIKQQQSSENQFEFTDTIESPTNVVLKGYAFLSTGFPVTNRLFIDIVSTKESKICKIQSEIDGSFTISNLIPGNAELQFSHPGCDSLKTNIYLALPEAELKITFQENPMSKISGIVLLEQDNKPVEGITVKAGIYNHKKPYSTCVTDKDGKFSLVLRERYVGVFDNIVIDEPGFGKVSEYVRYGTTFVKIILRQSGEVIGKVMTEDKKPVPGIKIFLNFMNFTGTSIGMDDSTSYTTVSDSKGNYKFPSVIAPAKYGFENSYDSGFTLPCYIDDDGFTVEVEPDKTAVCNLIVQKNTVLAFKAKDDNGNPFLKYELKCNVNSEHLGSTLEHNINLLDDDWCYVNSRHGADGFLSCVASENETGLNLITNNIPFSGKGTNYITLIFSDLEPNITGYILKPDGSPAKNCTIHVYCKKNHTEITADETGYFKVQGLNAKKGELININASTRVDNSNISTNLLSGSKDVVLTLLQPCKITGRVFLNNLKTPAKSFGINIKNDNNNGSRFTGRNTKDGYFDIFVFDFSLKKKKTGTITISVKGYSSEKFKYDFSNKNICDLGDIILKTDKLKVKLRELTATK